jgi:hypothetical protein
MEVQTTGPDGVNYVLQYRLARQQGLELVCCAPRRQKALTPA